MACRFCQCICCVPQFLSVGSLCSINAKRSVLVLELSLHQSPVFHITVTVCPSTKIISSRVCAGRLSSYIKLFYSIKDQTSFLFPSVLSPFSWSLYKGCVCFLQRSGRLPGHLNLLSCVQPLIMNLLCCNLQQFAVLACKQVLQAYSRKFTQIPQLSLAADLCSL